MAELLIFLAPVIVVVGIFGWGLIRAAAKPTPKPANFLNFGAE